LTIKGVLFKLEIRQNLSFGEPKIQRFSSEKVLTYIYAYKHFIIMRLVQLLSEKDERKVALVNEEELLLLQGYKSIYEIVLASLLNEKSIREIINKALSGDKLDYQKVWKGTTNWNWLPCFDHPNDVNACMVSGTGLTHKASAENRNKMHDAAVTLTDSLKMYLMGEDAGKPQNGEIGVQPEWFYKGNGTVLKGHLANLDVPSYALDGGEEPEVAGIYVINMEGIPVRIGFAAGNEFSDHVMEKLNYLYLAPSKIRSCSIGPELIIDEAIFNNISGQVAVLRGDKIRWQKEIKTGVENMAHSLENLEYHHFKYANHRVPGQVHVHFFGTGAFSFGDGIKLENSDKMVVNWPDLGKPLINTISNSTISAEEIKVIPLK
jgi:hypothetical protein